MVAEAAAPTGQEVVIYVLLLLMKSNRSMSGGHIPVLHPGALCCGGTVCRGAEVALPGAGKTGTMSQSLQTDFSAFIIAWCF